MTQRKKLIVVEGGEGAGKTTQLQLIRDLFPNDVVVTREPGGSPFAEVIRGLMLNHEYSRQASSETQFGLVWAARHDHLQNMIIPALADGKNVVTDRFDSSTFAYQIHAQDGGHLEDLFWLIREKYLRDLAPSLYIFLDVDPEVGMKRVAARKGDQNHFDDRKLNFHKAVREGYLHFMKRVPSKIINANRSLAVVSAEFEALLRQELAL